jgi:aminopeptidase
VDDRFTALAELAVRGANVQSGQLVAVNATVGQEELARAVARAAYRRGARYVDVVYFDPFVKRARIAAAAAETLSYVPPWYVERLSTLAAEGAARVSLAGVVEPAALQGLDPALLGRDQLPWLKEITRVIDERSTNWTIVPCPHPAWAALVYPELAPGEAYERLWSELWHVLRLDEPDPEAAWERRIEVLAESARALNAWRFDALELRGPGTELTVGLLPWADWDAAAMETRAGIRHLPNLPTEEVFTTPDPVRTSGYVTATRPLVLKDGLIVRGLRVRFEAGRAVEVEAEENGAALRVNTEVDEGAARLGEVALVDSRGRIGPLGTVFYDTLLDENAASHIALGSGVTSVLGPDGREHMNRSGIHIDFMIGSPTLEVFGVTADGRRVPVLVNGDWQL